MHNSQNLGLRLEELIGITASHLEKAKKRVSLGQGLNALPLMDEMQALLQKAETLASQLRTESTAPPSLGLSSMHPTHSMEQAWGMPVDL